MAIRDENTEFDGQFESYGEETVDATLDSAKTTGGQQVVQATENGAPSGGLRPVDAGVASTPQGEADAEEIPSEVIPDLDNVVRLPATVSLEFVSVVGSDLVLTQPDGATITIKNAALNIPTFYLGSVEIPQLTLTSALEANGINVAAGPDGTLSVVTSSDSSGGNFETPVPGIGDADPILGLLPPTALSFPELEERELFPDLRRPSEPLDIIRINPEELAVSDPALYNGTDPTSDDEVDIAAVDIQAGTSAVVDLRFDVDLSGIQVVDSNGDPILDANGIEVVFTWQLDNGNHTLLGFVNGEITPTIQIDISLGANIPPGTLGAGEITLVLLEGFPHQYGVNGDDFARVTGLPVVGEDADGNTDTATFSHIVIDDVPTAVEDVDSAIEGGVADGNVLTGSGGVDANATDGSADAWC